MKMVEKERGLVENNVRRLKNASRGVTVKTINKSRRRANEW